MGYLVDALRKKEECEGRSRVVERRVCVCGGACVCVEGAGDRTHPNGTPLALVSVRWRRVQMLPRWHGERDSSTGKLVTNLRPGMTGARWILGGSAWGGLVVTRDVSAER